MPRNVDKGTGPTSVNEHVATAEFRQFAGTTGEPKVRVDPVNISEKTRPMISKIIINDRVKHVPVGCHV